MQIYTVVTDCCTPLFNKLIIAHIEIYTCLLPYQAELINAQIEINTRLVLY